MGSRSEEAGSVWMEKRERKGTERSVGVTGVLVSVLGEIANRSSAGKKGQRRSDNNDDHHNNSNHSPGSHCFLSAPVCQAPPGALRPFPNLTLAISLRW